MPQAAVQIIDKFFSGKCIDFGCHAIGRYALVRVQRLLASRPIDTVDAQIAAIGLKAQLGLITRSTKDFEGINDLSIINSWLSHLIPRWVGQQ